MRWFVGAKFSSYHRDAEFVSIAYSNIPDWLVVSTKTQSTCSVSGTVYSCGLWGLRAAT